MKTKTHNTGESVDKQTFKKSYLKRVLEDREADQEIERCVNYEIDAYKGEGWDGISETPRPTDESR